MSNTVARQPRDQTFFEELVMGKTTPFTPKKVKTKQAEWVTIDHLQAKHIFKYYNKGNRKPSKNQILKYAEDMKSDHWKETGETLSFDKAGNLANGQHRLGGMILAEKEFEFLVTYGLDREVFDVLDTGIIRTGGVILGLDGHQDAINLNALVRAIIAYENNGDFDAKSFKGVNQITVSQVKEYIEDNSDVITYLDKYKKSSVVSTSIASFCYWALSTAVDRKTAETYLDMVLMGYGLTPNTLEYYLFEKLQRNSSKSSAQTKLSKTAVIANIILGWRRYNGWSKSKTMQITWDHRKGLPSPVE
jgi:hypothetical protein